MLKVWFCFLYRYLTDQLRKIQIVNEANKVSGHKSLHFSKSLGVVVLLGFGVCLPGVIFEGSRCRGTEIDCGDINLW